MKHLISNIAIFVACLTASAASAKELDQLTDRLLVLRYYAGGYRDIRGAPGPSAIDATLDARMNALLDQLARALDKNPPKTRAERDARVRLTFQHRLLPELVTPYEEWVKRDAQVPLYKVRDKGIFGDAVDYDDMRMAWYIELSPILQVGGVLIGIDKLGHFLAQGFDYYEHARGLHTPERYAALRAHGHEQELRQLGIATGGVYSFADLAANWAGMSFFMALFDDVDIEGDAHARYFERTQGRHGHGHYRRVRDFHWAEWVSPDWDEAQNPAGIAERALFEKVSANLRRAPQHAGAKSICEHYRADPNAYLGPSRALRPRERYAVPERAAAVAPYALDVRAICAR